MSNAEARAWLIEHGHPVARKGKIKAELLQIYYTAIRNLGETPITPAPKESGITSCGFCTTSKRREYHLEYCPGSGPWNAGGSLWVCKCGAQGHPVS